MTLYLGLNYWLKSEDTTKEPTNQNLKKVPKVFKPKNKIT